MARLVGYELGDRFARGGMAEVFLANPPPHLRAELGEHVAVKQLLPELEAKDEFLDMFLEEGKLALLLEHPNLVRTVGVGTIEGRHAIVMELLRGSDLRKLCKSAKKHGVGIPIEVVVRIAIDACRGLHAAHEARGRDGEPLYVVHRDVSPQNIFVGIDGIVKVVDFGIAKSNLRGYETQGGMLKGKVPYMAPEQIKCESLDRRADVYAMGVTLYECILDARPYAVPNATEFALMLAIAKHDIVAPRERSASFPVELEKMVLRAIAFDPDDRHPTCAALADDLERGAKSADRSAVARWVAEIFDRAGRRNKGEEATLAPQSREPSPREAREAHRRLEAHAVVAAIEHVAALTVVRFEGRIDERFSGRELGSALSGSLVLDLAGVERITSYGVRAWLEMLEAIPTDAEVHLYRCSEAVVAQLASSSAFAGRARVVSFVVPVVCDDCGATSQLAIDVERSRDVLLDGRTPERPCERCGGRPRLDDDPSILGFVRKHAGSPLPARVRTVVDELDVRHESGIGDVLEKIVTADETRIVVRRAPRRALRLGRALDGVEGKLVIDFRGMPTMDGATSAAVLAALRGLDDEVTAIDLREVPEALARVAVQAHPSARMRVLTVVTEGYCGSCCASRLGRVDGASYARALASSTPPAAECRRCGATLGPQAAPHESAHDGDALSGEPVAAAQRPMNVRSARRHLVWLVLGVVLAAAATAGALARRHAVFVEPDTRQPRTTTTPLPPRFPT